jgi:hypothetical protein
VTSKSKWDYFICGDADRVRVRVEQLLLSADLDGLADFSRNLSAAVRSIADNVAERFQCEVVVAGGDDIVIALQRTHYDPGYLRELSTEFHKTTGCSISFGCGPTPIDAFVNLHKAKANGGGVIYDE